MESLYLLLPLSVLLVLGLIALFAWALQGGQFDDLEREGRRVLDEDAAPAAQSPLPRETAPSSHMLGDRPPRPDGAAGRDEITRRSVT